MRIIAFILCVAMVFCVCGCQDKSNTVSEIVEYEEIIIDESGNEISSITSSNESVDDTATNQSVSSTDDTVSDKPSKTPVSIDYDTVVEIDICDDIIRGYLDATTPKTQYTFLSQYGESVLDYQNMQLDWQSDGSSEYTVYISENSDFSNAYVIKTINKTIKTTICVPGKTYYWKVHGVYYDEPIGGGKIKIKNAPVRWVKMDGVINVRDVGGWKTVDGKTVNYEKIYRGAKLDDITDLGLKTLKALGIKTDIDVRSTADWDTHNAVERTGLKYHFINTNYKYEEILNKNDTVTNEVSKNYQAMFALLADESNYPIYLHCGAGTDRTGSTMFILNGLLGVSYEDLTRDYELTSFATADRWRGNGTGGTFAPDDLIHEDVSNSSIDAKWGLMNKSFMESEYCTDGKLSAAIENYLLSKGVKQEHIDAYKKIMLS